MSNDTKQKQSARINWTKIAGKAANGAKALFEPIMPATFNTVSSTTSIMRDLRNTTRTTKSIVRRQTTERDNSAESRRSMNLFKSAFNDIASGNFSMDRINNEMYDDYETDTAASFAMPSGDEAADMSTEEILLLGNKGVAQSIIQSSSAQLRGLESSSKALIRSNVKSTQAMTASLNNTLAFGFGNLNTTLNVQNQKLDNINRNLQSILEFNNTNAIEYYSKSLDMLSGLGKMMENFDKSTNPDARKRDRKLDTSNGFNIKNYVNYIKEGFKESLIGTGVSMLKGSGGDGLKDFGIMGIISDILIPKTLKAPLEKFDKSLTRFFDEGFKRLGEKLNDNPIFAMLGLGDIFGSKRESIKGLNLGNYMKNATPWNGVAQKALVEVIPELLTSIDSKLDNSEKRYYDYDKGQFKSKSQIEKDMRDEYFDTLSIGLRDSMDKLTKAVESTGQSTTEKDRIISEIQALIDDQVSGSKDTKTARREMTGKMKEFGVSEEHISDFIMEFQSGLEGAISRINDLYHDIGSTQHIYRNINNSYSNEYSKDIKKMHGSRTTNYRTFSFGNEMDYQERMQMLLDKSGVEVDLSDRNFENMMLAMMKNRATDDEIIREIKKYAARKNVANKTTSKIKSNKYYSKLSKMMRTAGRKMDSYADKANVWMYETAYMDAPYDIPANAEEIRYYETLARMAGEKKGEGKKFAKAVQHDRRWGYSDPLQRNIDSVSATSPTPDIQTNSRRKENSVAINAPAVIAPVGPASSRMSNRKNEISTKEVQAREQVDAIASKDYSKHMDQSESANDRDQSVLSKAISAFKNSPLASTIEGSIIQSNNIIFTTLSTMLASFKGFTSRLFGKEGFFKKMWDSEARKKATDKLKEKLFTGENAIFKKQYEGAKAGLKNLKDKTLGYLGDGYDFVYDNTMKYMYGDEYENDERWQSNKFVSQTLNRKWRAEQKKKAAEAEMNAKEAEAKEKVDENTQGTQAQLLGLPEKSTSVDRSALKKRKVEIAKKLNAFESDRSKDDSDERKQLTTELESINETLRSPIEKTSNELMVVGDQIVDHTKAAGESMVGDLDKPAKTKIKEYKDNFFKKMKTTMPKALAGAAVGAGIGALNSSFSLLGSMFLPGGPIAGAIVGGGLSILTQTEAFKTFMFGKLGEDGKTREGGLISQKMRDSFKKMMPYAIGGAVMGGLKSLVTGALGFNSGLGVLGMQILPGGILGGALLGAGMGILKNSEGFKKMLFGEKGEDGKRSGKFLSDSFNKVKGGFSKMMPAIGKAGAGLGIGALTGAVLSNAGYIPAMFSMGGPVGMGVVGLGLGIASSTKKFNEWMFGSEELDENGNPTGKRRKDGMITRVQNLLMVNVVEPIGTAFKTKMADLVDWTKEKITYPFRLAFGPIMDSLMGIKDNVVEFVHDKFEALGKGIMGLFRNTLKTLFSPITKAIGFVGKSVMGVASGATKLALSPVSILLQGAQVLTAGKRIPEYMKFYKDYYGKGNLTGKLRNKWQKEEEAGNKRNIFSKMSDTIGTFLGQGDIADAARAGWNQRQREAGNDHALWREVPQEKKALKKARKERLEDEKKWRKIDKVRTKLANKLGGRELTLNDYTFEEYRKKFANLGISEEHLQSSDDIMDLLYRREDFKKKLDPNYKDPNAPVIMETPEQQAAREQTEKYQTSMLDFMDDISEEFASFADAVIHQKAIDNDEKQWRKDKKKLKRKLGKLGKNIDINAPELQDFDINEIDKDNLVQFEQSDFAEKGDLLGWMKSFGITQKSKYKKSDNEEPDMDPSDLNWSAVRDDHEKRYKNKDNPNSPVGLLQKMTDYIKSLLDVSEEQKEISSAQLEISTSGEIDDDTVKKRKGKSFGARLMSKFNAFTSWLGFNKKKDKKAAEDAEDPGAAHSAATLDGIDDVESNTDEEAEEKKGVFGTVWDKIKSVGSFIGNSKIGQFFGKAIKIAGAFGIPLVLGATILELIKPGSSKKTGDAIDSFNQSILNGEITWESLMDGLKNKVTQFGDKLLTGAKDMFGEEKVNKVVEWYKEHVAPKVDVVKTFILETIPEWAKATGNFIEKNADKVVTALSAVIEHLAPPLITAFVQVVPTIAAAIVKGILGGLGNLGEKALEKLGWKKPKSKTVSEKEANSDFKISGTRSRKNEMTGKKEVGEAQALSTLNSKSEATRNTVIQNAATGQYYIYDDEEQTQTRKYLDDESVDALMQDPEMASQIWYDPNTGAYFVEEARYEQYADNVYITADGKTKVQGNTDALPALGKVGLQMATRTAKGLPAISKGAKVLFKVAGKGAKLLGKGALKITGMFGVAGKAVSGMIKTGAKGAAKIVNLGKKIVTKKAAAEVITESAEKQAPKLLDKILKAFKGIKESKALRKVFDKFKKFLTTNIDDILNKFIKYLDDIAKKNFGKVTGKIAEKVSAKAATLVGKSAVTSIPIVTIVSAAWGLVDGALSAANLFEVPEDDVDWKMRLISSIMECLLSISVGCWIDLLFVVVELVSGLDLKHEIAMFLYKLLSGFDAAAVEKITNSQETLAAEAEVYNAINNTNMDAKSYNDKRNKTIWGKMWGGISSIWKDEQTEYEESGEKYSDYTKVLTKAGYTSSQIKSMTTEQVQKAVKNNIDNGALTGESKEKAKKSLGMGKGTASIGYGMYAQGDPRWGKMPIGTLPDGSVATMDKAGCGPTAMAAVANTVAERSLGRGPVTPGDVGAYAASNGYISQGGANAGLFTEGAERMGLNSSPISNTGELKQNLLAGKPAILTGKSNSSSDPYTQVGHIVMADGLYGDKMSVMDPITGKRKLYDINDVSKNTEHAWGYSAAGYGRDTTSIPSKAQNIYVFTDPEGFFNFIPDWIPLEDALTYRNPDLLFNPFMDFKIGDEEVTYKQIPTTYGGPADPTQLFANDSLLGWAEVDDLDDPGAIAATKFILDGRVYTRDEIKKVYKEKGTEKLMSTVMNTRIMKQTTDKMNLTAVKGLMSNGVVPMGVSPEQVKSALDNNDDAFFKKYVGHYANGSTTTSVSWSDVKKVLPLCFIDSATTKGYNTDPDTGIDLTIMNKNFEAFGANTTASSYYSKELSSYKKVWKETISKKTRNGSSLNKTRLHYILSTQYFGKNGGTFGTISITGQKNDKGEYKEPKSFSKEQVANIYAAAIISEHSKGNRFIQAPLSDAEKYLAICNALRVMYGFTNTVKFVSNEMKMTTVMNLAKDDDYKKIVALMGTDGGLLEPIEEITESTDTGIMNADQLREIAKNKKIFGKIRLTGLIMQAKINTILKGTDFWAEFAELTREDNNNSARNTPLTGASTSLQRAITSPRHIQEELLGKTIESVYIGETGGDYSKVINDSNNIPSIGPAQFQKEYAVNLLDKLRGADGLSAETRDIFQKYSSKMNSALSADEIKELSGALGDSGNDDTIKSIIDDYTMRYYHNRFYQPHLAGYYDNNIIKDLRTLPMLADIGQTGPAHIWATTGKYAPDSFITQWKPVAADVDFESAYNLLNSEKTYWKKSKYSNGYMKRIKNTYERLKDYAFRKSVKPGQLGEYFAPDTNPLGYGPLTAFSELGSKLTDAVNSDNTKLKEFSKGINDISNKMIGTLVDMTGLSSSDLGFALDNDIDSGGGGGTISSVYDGSYSMEDDVLTSITGTDRDRFIAAALSQVGYLEKKNASNLKSFTANPGSANYSKYNQEIAGKNGYQDGVDWMWCNAFTSWAGKAAGIPNDVLYRNTLCANTAQYYIDRGLYKKKDTYGGSPGDLVFFKNGSRGNWTNHIGIVTEVDSANKKITTVEGNATNKVQKITYDLSNPKILGFATPAWTGESKTVDPRTLLSLGYGKGSSSKQKKGNDKKSSHPSDKTYTGSDIDRYINVAMSQIGYLEKKDASNLKDFTANPGNNNYTKYVEEMLAPTVPNGGDNASWCNAFTSWVGKAANIPESIIYRNKYGRCTETMDHYKKKGLFKTPEKYYGKRGDLAFFNWKKNNPNRATHIGIVAGKDKFSTDNVYTIEGNTGSTNTGSAKVSGNDRVMLQTRKISDGTILGFATPKWTGKSSSVTPSKLLKLGYGDQTVTRTRIDSPAYREQLRKSLDNQEEFKVTPKDFEAIGFGPGMTVDAGFDMTNTDSKLDQIFGVLAEWFAEAKKSGAAQSSETKNVNVINAKTTNISQASSAPANKAPNVQRYKENLANHHLLISAKQNVRNRI